jgi:hypothetical protein
MVARTVLARLQKLIWIYIYGGLLSIVIATFVRPTDPSTAWWMTAIGGASVVLGIVLIFLRSRLKETP